MTKVVHLSDSSNFEEQRSSMRAEPSAQEVFEASLANELPIFAGILQNAFDTGLANVRQLAPSYHTPNSKAIRINEQMKGMLFERFPGNMIDDGERFWLARDPYRIFFKKLSRSSRPFNNETTSSKRILWQQNLFINDTVTIFVGYCPNTAWDEIRRMSAVYISQNEVTWVTDLRQFNSGQTQLPVFPQNPLDDAPLVVRPKANALPKEAVSTTQ